MSQCKRCSSHAINPSLHGRQPGVDLDLCDVCYWRQRAANHPLAHHNGLTLEVRFNDHLYSQTSVSSNRLESLDQLVWEIDFLTKSALSEILALIKKDSGV